MACLHPLHAFKIGITENGKDKYQIESSKITRIHARASSKSFYNDLYINEFVEIPCGKCIGCRLDYSKQWATRCMLEAKEHEHNQFITLTYNEENIQRVQGANRLTGEKEWVGNLIPEDLTKFMKDLRKYYKYHYNIDNIRFYACGEYGSNTFRPHFHLIVYNLPIEDKKYLFTNNVKDKIYTSDIIEKIWGKGLVTIGDVTWNSAAYVARYIMKKVKGPGSEEYYKALGVNPEFVRMSRRPGIAREYYEQNKDLIYKTDEIILANKKGQVMTTKPSKYFDKLFDIDSPECMKAIKEQRKKAGELANEAILAKTSLTQEEYLEQKERNLLAKTKKLVRSI